MALSIYVYTCSIHYISFCKGAKIGDFYICKVVLYLLGIEQ